jgi:N-acetylmuramoyl-L-alanine amidase CwlA
MAAKKKRKKSRRRLTKRDKQMRTRKRLKILMLIIIVILSFTIYKSCQRVVDLTEIEYPTYVSQQYIDVDGHSRTGQEMRWVNDIVIHYVANPGSMAQANRDYFNSPQSKVSAHFVVGLYGEVIQCVPLNEQSSASNKRNVDTISIEVCHPDASGQFNSVTYNRTVELTAWLCSEFGLDEKDVIRHYDVTGKNCPKYYVENEEAWDQMRHDIKEELKRIK